MFSPGVIQAVVRHTSLIRHNTAPACLCALFATVTTTKAYLRGAPIILISLIGLISLIKTAAPKITARQRSYQELVLPARLTG